MFRRWIGAVVLMSWVTPASAQSLGDAARKEAERRRKAAQEHPKSEVVTGENLATNKGQLANDPSIAPAVTSPSSLTDSLSPTRASTSQTAPSGSNSESYWRQRAASLRTAVTSAEAELKKAEANLSSAARAASETPTACGVAPQVVAHIGSIEARKLAERMCAQAAASKPSGSVASAQAAVESSRRQLVQAKTALAELDDEARRAGALPGWLR